MTEKLKVSNLAAILNPAKKNDSGYDIIASSDPIIHGLKTHDKSDSDYYCIDYIEYDTNLIIDPPSNLHTYIFPRSSISNYNLSLANSIGLIDNGYRGTLKLRFKYIVQPIDLTSSWGKLSLSVNRNKIYKKGDKIGQLVFAQIICPEIDLVEAVSATERGDGGFGSTGL